jgi:ribosomal protein L11 methyltransferase
MGKNFSPINVEDKVLIRAEFHEPILQWKKSLFNRKCLSERTSSYYTFNDSANAGNGFQRQKSFGYGLRNFRFSHLCQNERRKDVLAIDIDEWSVENSKENAERNNVELRIELGTAENLGKEKFDIILANINRNILISDIPTYVKDMNQGSELLLSGLCFFDVEIF